jgi:MATE family multidrug resistance protein
MYRAGSNPVVMAQCAPYMKALAWGIFPLLLFTAFRRYLQAVNVIAPITIAMVTSIAANFIGNWVLMYGHWGFPRMGLEGSGWSTSISRVYLALFLLAVILWHESRSGRHLFQVAWRPEVARIRRLLTLGLPQAGQIAFEGALFGVVTVLASRLDEVTLAAHGLAVQVIATTFMVPLGISSAVAVRVGQAVGRKDPRGVSSAGWAGILYSTIFMGAAGLALWLIPGVIVRGFIRDPDVIRAGSTLLRIAAFFELFDGFQIVTTGALRGLGDTRSPMFAHLVFYWAVGLPVAYLLCFRYGWGAAGIWVGLSAALILIGAVLLIVWHRRQKLQSRLV